MFGSARARVATALARSPNVGQTLAAFAIKMAGAVLSFALSWQVARAFGASGVGQFGLAVSTLTIAATLTLVGLDYVLIRTVAGDVHQGRRDLARGAVRSGLLFVGVGSVLMAALLLAGGVPALTALTGGREEIGLLTWTAIGVVPLALIRIVNAGLRGSGRVLAAQAIDGPLSTALACGALALVMMAVAAPPVTVVALVYVGGLTASVLVGWLLYRQTVRAWTPAAAVPLRPMLAQGWSILIVVLTAFAGDWIVLVTLAASYSSAEVGQFRTAWQIASVFTVIATAFDSVAGPRIAAAHRAGDMRAIAGMWRQAIGIMTVLALPVLVATVAFPGFLLGLFGPEFPPAANALRVLAAGQLLNMVTGPVGSILTMTGRDRGQLVIALVGIVVLVAACLLLIPRYGPLGAAGATALALSFRKLCGGVVAMRALNLRLFGRSGAVE